MHRYILVISLRKIMILAALCLAPARALAAPAHLRECVETRLDRPAEKDRPRGSLHGVPVMYQADARACAAYTAAQLVDAFRFQNPRLDRRHLTSPLAASVSWAQKTGHETIFGGSIQELAELISAKGSCAYQKVGDRFGTHDLNGFVKELRLYFDSFQLAGKNERATHELACYLEKENFLTAEKSLHSLGKIFEQKTFADFFYAAMKEVCRENFQRLEKKPRVTTLENADFLSALDRKNKYQNLMDTIQSPTSQPLGIYLCQELAFDRNLAGLQPNGQREDGCTLHAAMVVGRRRSPSGDCQILVRNAWGTSCGGYDWDCDIQDGHDTGQIWIDEDRLLENMIGVVRLE